MSILQLIGNTPLVKLEGFDTGLCELFVKLESQNPGGSIKDRIAVSMIQDAEEKDLLKPGGTIVEATAGNTGLGLALVAVQRGYKLLLVIPDKMSREKIEHLKAMGAQVVLTRSDVPKGHPEYYQEKAERLSKEIPGSWYVNQFGNPANPLAHERTTAPEIYEQMRRSVDAIICGVGSSGTITGISRYFARVSPETEIVLADPEGSILAHYVKTGEVLTTPGSWLVEGIGEDFIPPVSDLSRVKKAYTISDKESLLTARAILQKNGILAGSSSGTLVSAAVRYCREQTEPKRVVTFICDSGSKYLSKMFNDFWMREQGMIDSVSIGDLRDLIPQRYDKGEGSSAEPDESLRVALTRMQSQHAAQLPVLEEKRIVGIIDESDLLLATYQDQSSMLRPVKDFMSTALRVLRPEDPIEKVLPLFDSGMVAIVADETAFYGIITRHDFLMYLQKKK